MSALPRTLILDYRDSYTNNLLTLFVQLFSDEEVARQVVIVQADSLDWTECQRVLTEVDCVILSPGPGRPDNPADIGYALQLIREVDIPLLGICLGLQSLAVAYGGKIINTPNLRHGHLLQIHHSFQSIFDRLPPDLPVGMVAYNSLTVDPITLPEELEVIACALEEVEGEDGGKKVVRTVQGLGHRTRSQWGVQFHPESIASSHGCDILSSFLHKVRDHHHTISFPPLSPALLSRSSTAIRGSLSPQSGETVNEAGSARLRLAEEVVYTEEKGMGRDVAEVFDGLFRAKESPLGEVWLDGVSPKASTTSSMAIPSFVITYTIATRMITITSQCGNAIQRHAISLSTDQTFWDWFAEGQADLRRSLSGDEANIDEMGVSWKGGWVGWWGYEMKAESLGGYALDTEQRTDVNGEGDGGVDACWAWCDQILQWKADGVWVARGVVTSGGGSLGQSGMMSAFGEAGIRIGLNVEAWNNWTKDVKDGLRVEIPTSLVKPVVEMPSFKPDSSAETYQAGIKSCRDSIYAGDSYELTLTTTFSADVPSSDPNGFALYTNLRLRNPAPYSAYLHFPFLGKAMLSSSPERFLRIDRMGRIQMKPIKGTRGRVRCTCVEKGVCRGPGGEGCAEGLAVEDAAIGEELRTDGKERAENLMIVDLIRSDLQSCCVSSSVKVPKLIALETYETVHQLVTTVTGQLEEGVDEIQAVKRCFPPGSMTGAPKLRSVQILDELEGHKPRGIYSGAMGYMSIDGAVDLSVVIRTIVMDTSTSASDSMKMRIGAGGAITWLSDPVKEWEEVLTKVGSVTGRLGG